MSRAAALIMASGAALLLATAAGAQDPPRIDAGMLSGLGIRNIGSATMSGRVSALAATRRANGDLCPLRQRERLPVHVDRQRRYADDICLRKRHFLKPRAVGATRLDACRLKPVANVVDRQIFT